MNKIIALVALTLVSSACGAEDFGPSDHDKKQLSQEICEFADACDNEKSACDQAYYFIGKCADEEYMALSCLNEYGFCDANKKGIEYRFIDCGHLFALREACLESNGG